MYWGDTRGRAKRAGKESEGIVKRVREKKTGKVTTAWRGKGGGKGCAEIGRRNALRHEAKNVSGLRGRGRTAIEWPLCVCGEGERNCWNCALSLVFALVRANGEVFVCICALRHARMRERQIGEKF